MTFHDHFSERSPGYARFRPRYPDALFDWIASECHGHARVWDCATGNGQAAVSLARVFEHVVATDASDAQLSHAAPHARVRYVRTLAERAGLATASVDAITAAQAIHWFDFEAFFREAGRVGRRGALLVVWTYGNPSVDAGVDPVLDHFYRDVVGPYWPPERRLIERMYQDVHLPFTPVRAPGMPMDMPMTLDALIGYVDTWSGVKRYRDALAADPVPALKEALARVWGDADAVKTTRWPMAIRAARV